MDASAPTKQLKQSRPKAITLLGSGISTVRLFLPGMVPLLVVGLLNSCVLFPPDSREPLAAQADKEGDPENVQDEESGLDDEEYEDQVVVIEEPEQVPESATVFRGEDEGNDLPEIVLHLPGWNLDVPGPWKFRPKQDIENQLPFQIASTGIANSRDWLLRDINSRSEERHDWDVIFLNPETGETRTVRMNQTLTIRNRAGQEIVLSVYHVEKYAAYLENRHVRMLSPGIVRIGEPLKYGNLLNVVHENNTIHLEENVPEKMDGETWVYRGLRKEKRRFFVRIDNPPKARYKIWIPY